MTRNLAGCSWFSHDTISRGNRGGYLADVTSMALRPLSCSYFSSRLPSISYMRWGSFSIACVCHDTPDCTHNLILLLTRLCNKWGCCCKWRHIRQDCVSNLIIVLCDHLYAPARRTATDTLPRIAGSTPSSTRRFAIHACLSLLATFRASFAMYSA